MRKSIHRQLFFRAHEGDFIPFQTPDAIDEDFGEIDLSRRSRGVLEEDHEAFSKRTSSF